MSLTCLLQRGAVFPMGFRQPWSRIHGRPNITSQLAIARESDRRKRTRQPTLQASSRWPGVDFDTDRPFPRMAAFGRLRRLGWEESAGSDSSIARIIQIVNAISQLYFLSLRASRTID